MLSATLTSKGQITIPSIVRIALEINAGDRVEFVKVGPGRFEVVAATGSVQALKGMFGNAKKVASIEQISLAIARKGAGAK